MTLALTIQMLLSHEIIVVHKKTGLRRCLPTQKLTITLQIDSLHKPVSPVLLFNSQAHPSDQRIQNEYLYRQHLIFLNVHLLHS